MAQVVEIRDFSVADAMLQFRVGSDLFEALPDIPLTIIQQVSKLTNVRQEMMERGVDAILEITDMFLTDESAALFRQRVMEKKIGLRVFMNVIQWLLEEYGVRPTPPSSNSSAGSSDGETGTSSTDGVPLGELIP